MVKMYNLWLKEEEYVEWVKFLVVCNYVCENGIKNVLLVC